MNQLSRRVECFGSIHGTRVEEFKIKKLALNFIFTLHVYKGWIESSVMNRVQRHFKASQVFENDQQFDFIVSKEAIFEALIESKNNEKAIGIYCPSLTDTMVITGIENIMEQEEDVLIILKQYDMSGHMLEKNSIYLSEISSVCPFKSPVKNPFLEHIQRGHDWYTIINSPERPPR